MRVARHPYIEDVVLVTSDEPGPRIVMFCGVHGDEVSGIHAIEKLLFDFFGGKTLLTRGSVTLVRANREAMQAERRYVRYNLNRMFRVDYPPEIDRTSYEFRRAQELKPLLESCDYFLDLHSAPIADAPFLVAERKAVEFYSRLGIPRVMTGWSKFSQGPIGGDAENYANAHGALSATLESGSHFDKASNDAAYGAVVRLLSLLDVIDGETVRDVPEAEVFEMYAVILKGADDFRYAGEVSNFQFFEKGKPFAYENGRALAVAEGTNLLIPMRPVDIRIGEEVCYLGRKVNR